MSELRRSSMGSIPSSEVLTDLVEDLIFHPTVQQRKAKATFWAKQREMPIMIEAESITEAHASRITGDSKLKNWWKTPGFKAWFTDSNDYISKVEYLFDLSLESLERIISSEDPKTASARVNAIKLVAELSNKMPNRFQKQSYADELINKMDEVQLEAYLERKGVNLKLTAKSGASKNDNEKARESIEATVLDSSLLGDVK